MYSQNPLHHENSVYVYKKLSSNFYQIVSIQKCIKCLLQTIKYGLAAGKKCRAYVRVLTFHYHFANIKVIP